jgi:hypothetical protein
VLGLDREHERDVGELFELEKLAPEIRTAAPSSPLGTRAPFRPTWRGLKPSSASERASWFVDPRSLP